MGRIGAVSSSHQLNIPRAMNRLRSMSRPSELATFAESTWALDLTRSDETAVSALERGDVLFFPGLSFSVTKEEFESFSPAVVRSAKQVSYDPSTGRIGGAVPDGEARRVLAGLLARFSRQAAAFVNGLCPRYRLCREGILAGRASFRPVEVAGRKTSWRKDDTRLHIDSFPATPVQGRRILRLFTNVNPARRSRVWRIGEDFEAVAGRFAPQLTPPWPGSARVLEWLRLTKTRRSAYDAIMLQLHDRMKADVEYQARCVQTTVEFPSGSTWVAYTDQVSHAAMAGQYQLEQTFLVPVAAMLDEPRSPLRVLERLKGRTLV